jgi:riboflavin-specific deaminase-like protein
MNGMQRIWPDPAPLDPTRLAAAYGFDRTRPTVRMNFVSSLDGAVEVDGYSRGLSDEADQRVLQALRVHADAVMVGAGTLRHEGYGPVRLTDEEHKTRTSQGIQPDPTLVVVSSSLALDPTQKALAQAPVRPIVLTHAAAPAQRRAELAEVADVVDCGDAVVDLAVGLAELRTRGLAHVLCEGGPHLFGALLSADLVDEMCLTVSAKLAGSGAGRIVADGPRDTPAQMRLVHVIAAGDTLLTRYARR